MKNKVKIDEVCRVYDGPHATPTKISEGPIYLGVDAITDSGRLNPSEYNHLSETDYIKWTKRVTPQENDIVFSYEATLGRYAIIPKDFYGCLGRRLAIVRAKDDRINPKWLFYYFLSPQWSAFIANNTVKGSTVNRISVEDFPNFEIPLPTREEQDKIVDILSAIDRKIDNNTELSNKIESMIKMLYDYWFVQFEFPNEEGKPYRSSKGEMVWCDELKKEIPKGWSWGNLYNIAEYINGAACQKYRPIDEEDSLPVIKIAEMHNGITNKTERVSANIPSKYIIERGDILFSWSATLEVMYWLGEKGGLNQHIFKVIPKKNFSKEYVYQQLKQYIIKFVKIAESRKTTMGHITSDHLEQSRIILPPENIVDIFTQKVSELSQLALKKSEENIRLQQLRDWLLPLLMNGQATIK